MEMERETIFIVQFFQELFIKNIQIYLFKQKYAKNTRKKI